MSLPINTGPSDYSLHCYWDAVTCPQMYAYKYILQLKTPPEHQKDYFAFGTAVHFLLANHYSGRPLMDGAENLDYDITAQLAPAQELVDEYLLHYRAENVDVVCVETQVIVEIGKHKLSRRFDLGIRKDDRLFIIDHKTAYNPRSRLFEAQSDPSLYSQEIVAEASGFAAKYGLEYGGFILNVLGKKKEDGPARFVRKQLSWGEGWKDSFVATMQDILAIPERFGHLDPWKWPRWGSCVGRYGVCEFRDLCMFGPSVMGKYL